LEYFVERESIFALENPQDQYAVPTRRALSDTVASFGASEPEEEVLEKAMCLVHAPRPFPEALSSLKTLSRDGYTVFLISPFDSAKLTDLFGEDVTHFSSKVIHMDSLYSPLSEDTLQTLLHYANTDRPGILRSQIMIATSNVVRAVEPSSLHGLPSVHVRRPSSLECRVKLAMSPPTFEVSDLSNLSARIKAQSVDSVEGAAETSNITHPHSGARKHLKDLSDPHRIGKLYQSTGVLGAGSCGQ
jgi:hypothetical protein